MTAIADSLAAMADGRLEPLTSTKGHAGGTTPSGDESDERAPESLVTSSEGPRPKHHARRHRHRRQKAPGHGSESDRPAPSATNQAADANETSPGADREQPQPTSIRTVQPW